MSTMKLAASMLVLIACGGSGDGVGNPQPDGAAGDSPVGDPSMLPTWRLQDVQPGSPMVGQTYGLDAFAGKVIVVTLLEGF
jgi:hypothetical protein